MFEAQVEPNDAEYGYYITLNSKRLGPEFLSETDAHHVKNWLNRSGSAPGALDDILAVLVRGVATPAGEGGAASVGAVDLPVLGTVSGGLTRPPGETLDTGPDQLSMQEALAAYDTLAHSYIVGAPAGEATARELRRILERRRA